MGKARTHFFFFFSRFFCVAPAAKSSGGRGCCRGCSRGKSSRTPAVVLGRKTDSYNLRDGRIPQDVGSWAQASQRKGLTFLKVGQRPA